MLFFQIKQLEYMKENFEQIFINAQNEFSERCCNIIEDVLEGKSEKNLGSTDCNIPLSLGIPAVCIGTFEGAGGHTREEWIYKKGLEIALEPVTKIAGEDSV